MDSSQAPGTWFRSRDELLGYNPLKTPIWIFDVDRHAIWWGNRSALKFWNAGSLDDLMARDFSTDSQVVRARLRRIVDHTVEGESVQESWTIHPAGHPVTAVFDLKAVRIGDGRDALLIEASHPIDLSKDPEALRILEAARNTPLMVSTFSIEGLLLAQNPAAAACYESEARPAALPRALKSRFEDPAVVEEILASVRRDQPFQSDCAVMGAAGPRIHRSAARRGRDPVSGEVIIVLTEEDVTERAELEAELARLNQRLEDRVEERTEDLLELNRELTQQILDRKDAESALRDQFVLLQSLIDAMPAPVFYKDTSGKYLGCNDAFQDFIGLGREAILGKSDFGIAPDELARTYQEADDELFERGGVQIYETQVRYADGSRHDVVLHKATFGRETGSLAGIVGVMLDVTDQKQAEERLRRAQQLESLGKLTGGVAHDFNNLLTVVLGNLELIADEIGPDSDLQDCARAALRAVKRGADLTQQLLAYARKQPLAPRAIDVNGLLSEMTGLLRRSLGETIVIETRLSPDLWPAQADLSQLQNAILNLCLNARDAMALPGGRLTIETQALRIGSESREVAGDLSAGEYVSLVVRDTGRGMSSEVLERATEPFFSTKDLSQGGGLGLSMVFGFAKQSGGTLVIESKEGEGTATTIYLPRAVEDGALEESGATGDDISLSGAVALVVEDDAELRRYMAKVLQLAGCRVIEAHDGPSARSRLQEPGRIDLLLTDVILPGGLSGPDLAETARARDPAPEVLFISGYPEDKLVTEDPGQGTLDWLPKPFTRAQLLARIRGLLDVPVDR